MGVELRHPTPADSNELAALHVSTWQETYAEMLPDDFFSDAFIAGRRSLWDRVLADPNGIASTWIAVDDGALVGFAWTGSALDQDPPRSTQLYAIYVAASHHSRGIGQSLLDAALGDRPATLWVAQGNDRAITFYERNGFRFDGVEQKDPSAPRIVDARMIR